MQIAYLTETWPPEVNGVSLTVERTVRYLRERGHGVRVLRPRQRDEAARDSADEWRTPGLPIPMYPDLRFGLAWPGALRARLAGCDLLHVATPGPLAWAAVHAARGLGLPTSSDFRTNFHQYSGYYGLAPFGGAVFAGLRLLHNATDCTFVPTAEMHDALAPQGFERLAIVGRGVDCVRFAPAHRSAALRASWGAQEGDLVLLHVGRLAPEKNVRLALRCFERLRRTRSRTHLVLVGDGPSRGALAAACPAARFLGMKTGAELAACFASADVFLFPSLSETFGNVTLEALASGLPVVAFQRGAAAEHVRDGREGCLVRPGDEDGFVDAALRLAMDATGRASMGESAVAAARRAQWHEVLGGFERRLLDVVQRRAVGEPAWAGHE